MTAIPNLTDSAMLVYITLSVWSARKLDKKQTLKTIKGANATSDAARVNKHLLANADTLLRNIQRKANEIRAYVEVNTLPWDDAGNRLISNAQSLVMVGDMHRLKSEFNEAVEAFIAEYPRLREQALKNLGDMASSEDYPPPEVVRRKFSMKLSFTPVPEKFSDIRVGMSEAQAKAWQNAFESNVRAQVDGALRSAWERLRENLQRYSDRLRLKDDGSGKMEVFRDTMVTGLRDTISLLSSLNVFGDPQLEQVMRQVSNEIAVFEPDMLRANPSAAVAVRMEVDEILARMKNILGE